MEIIGYSITSHFNDTEMYERASIAVPKCPVCGYRTELFPHNPNYAFRKSFKPVYLEDMTISNEKTACSETYDCQWIVSWNFKLFCEEQKYEGLTFLDFVKDKWHFHLIVNHEIKIDLVADEGPMRYEKLCPACQKYEWIGPPPKFFQVNGPLADGFYRSDLIFGDAHGRHPLTLIGIETMKKLKAMKFKALTYQPIYRATGQ